MSSKSIRSKPTHASGKDVKPHKSSRSGGGSVSNSKSPAVPSQGPRFSFLFIINELHVNLEPAQGGAGAIFDSWGNTTPPSSTAGYPEEGPGAILRYVAPDDGSGAYVEEDPEYSWLRNGPGERGSVVLNFLSYKAQYVDGREPTLCREATVFSCSPLLPVVVTPTDACLGSTYIRSPCGCGTLVPEQHGDVQPHLWSLLHFQHGEDGVSRVVPNASGRPFVCGRNPSWLPALVPQCYANTRSDTAILPSRGLGGDISIILGLMGFHGHKDHASDVFTVRDGEGNSGLWRKNKWYGGNVPPAFCPKPEEDPRGLLVHVYLDDLENPEGSTEERLAAFEWYGIIVRG